MTLQSMLSNFATAVGTDIKALTGRIGTLSSLTTTAKTDAVSAINEVRAMAAAAAGTGGGAPIDDVTATSSTVYSSSRTTTLFAPKANPVFTGTVQGVTAAHVGLGSVNNTADTAKPVSTAQAAAILALISDSAALTDLTKTWSVKKTNDMINLAVANLVGGAPDTLNALNEISAALGADPNFAATMTTQLGNRLKVDGTSQTIVAANQDVARANINAASASAVGNTETDLVAVYTTARGTI